MKVNFYLKNGLNKNNLFNFLSILVPLFYYGFFMSRTMGYVDSSLVLNNAFRLDISAWVDNHNLFSLLTFILMKIFGKIDPFVVSNFFSMTCGAFTIFFTFLITKEISKNIIIAGITSIVLMLSHSMTFHSTMLEVYTLNTFLIMVILYCFYKYFESNNINFAYIGTFSWGLGISNHILMGLFVFAFISFLIIKSKSLTFVNIFIGLVSFFLGSSLFLYAFFKTAIRYDSLFTAWNLNTGGDFRSLMFSSENLLFWIKNYFYFFIYQFSIIAIILGFIGFKFFLNRKHFSIFFLTSFFVQFIWSLNYHVWDIFAFSLPIYVMFTVPIAASFALIKKPKIRLYIFALLVLFSTGQLFFYKNIDKVNIVRKYIASYPMVEMVGKSYDPVKYYLNPWKRGFHQIEQYVDMLFKKLPYNAFVYDNNYDYPIVYYYQEIKKERLDIYSPVIFPFWVTEEAIQNWSKKINIQVNNLEKVYLSEFVFNTLDENLKYGGLEKIIIINKEYLYLLKK